MLGNVSRLFCENMLYVGLSRAPSLDSVALSDDFKASDIKQHEVALDFFRMLEQAEESCEDSDEEE